MFSKLRLLLAAMLGDSLGRILSGAGLALTTGAVMTPLVAGALDAVASAAGGLPGDLLQVAAMGGIGEAMGIIGSAMLTRVAIQSARVGLKKAAST